MAPYTHPWDEDLLGNLAEIIVGGTPSTAVARYWDGDIPWMSSGDVHMKRITDVQGRITLEGLQSSNAKLIDPPAVAVALAGQGKTRGTAALILTKTSTNQSVAVIKPYNSQLNTNYLYHMLSFRYKELRSRSAGDGRAGLSKRLIEAVPIPVPPKIEQKQIAVILDIIDSEITQTESLIAKYQRIKTGLMQDLLTRGIDENGNLRDPATHEFKEVEGYGRVPVEWECTNLGKCIELHNNLRKPISAIVREGMKGVFPYYGATGIVDYINEYKVEGEFILMGEDGDHFLKYLEQEMTIIAKGKFNVSNHAHIIKGKEKCSNEWIHHYFAHRDITLHLTRQGAGRYKLNKATLLSLPIVLPKPHEQSVISIHLFSIQNTIDLYFNQLSKLRRLKAGLMQDLLTGKVSVTPLLNQEGNQTGQRHHQAKVMMYNKMKNEGDMT